MNLACSSCGVAVGAAVVVGCYIHLPADRGELLRVLRCTAFGHPLPYRPMDEETAVVIENMGRWAASW